MAKVRSELAAPWAQATCLLAGVAMPLAFHTFGTLGFEAAKVALLRLLALILGLGWLAGQLATLPRPLELDRWRRFPRETWALVLTLLAFLAVSAVSTALSIAPARAFWGSYDRVQGLVTLGALAVLGVAAAITGRAPAGRERLIRWWLLASVPVCLYAFAQQFALDPIGWLNQPDGVASTLGSSTALGTYLAMLAPLTLARALERRGPASGSARRRRARIHPGEIAAALWACLFTLQTAALIWADVRAALVALSVGLGAAAAAACWLAGRRARAAASLGAALALAVVVAITLGGDPLAGGSSDQTDEPDIVAGGTTRQRLLIWEAALITAASSWRLGTGFGLETQSLALETRFPIELANLLPNQRFDRAHNLVLDQLLTTGLLGVSASAGLLAVVGTLGLRAGARLGAGEQGRTAGLVGALAANLAANLFAFDLIGTAVLLWMVGGLLVAPALVGRPRRSETDRRLSRARPASGPSELMPRARLRATATLAAASIGALAAPWLVGPLVADLSHTRALALRAAEAPASSIAEQLNAIDWQPGEDVYVLALGETFQLIARDAAPQGVAPPTRFEQLAERLPEGREALFGGARLAFERAVALSPLDPYSHLHLARFWAEWADVARDPALRAERLDRAADEYAAAIHLSPNRPTLHDEAGLALARAGRFDESVEQYGQADRLSRPTAERIARVGDVLARRGDEAGARERYLAALGLDARSAPAHHGLARLARSTGDLSAALDHAQRAARSQMRNWEYRLDLALIHRDLGNWDEALVEARSARRFAPAWERDELSELVEAVRRS